MSAAMQLCGDCGMKVRRTLSMCPACLPAQSEVEDKARKAFAAFSNGGFAGKRTPKSPYPEASNANALWQAAYSVAMTSWFAA